MGFDAGVLSQIQGVWGSLTRPTLREALALGFYLGAGLLVLYALFVSVKAFRHRITWGQARRMGSSFALFLGIQALFYAVLIEGVYDVIGLLLGTPLWLDIGISISIVAAAMLLLLLLSRRPRFKRGLFTSLVLVHLGLPGTHMLARVSAAGVSDAAQTAAVVAAKADAPKVSGIVGPTVVGFVEFEHTAAIGRIGDHLTALRLTGKGFGFVKLQSKTDGVHGIDGVFVKYAGPARDCIVEIRVVETKVNGGRLAPGQMSDAWINTAVAQMVQSSDSKVRGTGRLLRETLDRKPEIVRKELWHHNFETGATTVFELDPDGAKLEAFRFVDSLTVNRLAALCGKPSYSGCKILPSQWPLWDRTFKLGLKHAPQKEQLEGPLGRQDMPFLGSQR